jgi:hypothetical protein
MKQVEQQTFNIIIHGEKYEMSVEQRVYFQLPDS